MKRRRHSLALYYLLGLTLLCFLLPLFLELDPVRMDPTRRLAPISLDLPFGADRYGRDLFAQIIYGGRVSLSLAAVTTLLSLGIGTTIGLYAAFYPRFDKLIMRLVDAMMAIPAILLAIALMTLFSASAGNIILALTLLYTPSVARLARATAMPIRSEAYIEALQIAGASRSRQIWHHALPNLWQGLFIRSAFIFSEVIISEAALSFLGAGLAARTPSWGNIIAAAKLDFMKAPRLILIPAFFIFSLLFALATVGDFYGAERVLPRRGRQKKSLPSEPGEDLSEDLLALRDLHLSYATAEGQKTILKNLSLEIAAGEVVALLGESGSGKSSLARLALSLIDSPEAEYSGQILYAGTAMPLGSPEAIRLRGQTIALIPQDPTAALDPLQRIEAACEEVLALQHPGLNRAERRARIYEALRLAEIEPSQRILRSYPHQLSGGQKQRILIALALLQGAQFLIADEPSSALDSRLRRGLIELFQRLSQEQGIGILFITHELSLLEDFAERILILEAGEIVSEVGANPRAEEIEQPYARALFAAQETVCQRKVTKRGDILLSVLNLEISYRKQITGAWRKQSFTAVADLSFDLARAECLALVGASGSGKSSSARAIVGLAPQSAGEILWRGVPLADLAREERQKIQMIFQHPQSSFDPRQKIEAALREVAKVRARDVSREELEEVLVRVKLEAGSLDKYPLQFSGGQAQRLALARALLMGAEFLILDEALSALDVLIKREIMDLLIELQEREGLAYLLITHDPKEARYLAHRVLDLDAASRAKSQSMTG